MTYAGHHADGSSVQNHSAGPLYPFVVYAVQGSTKLRWGVQGCGIDTGASLHHEETAREIARLLRLNRLHGIAQYAQKERAHQDPMIRMSTELLGCVWEPDVKGIPSIPSIHTRRVQSDHRAVRALWAQNYCENNKDLPVAVVADGLRIMGFSRQEISTAITTYVMGVV